MNDYDEATRLLITRTRMDDVLHLTAFIKALCEHAEKERREAVGGDETPAYDELAKRLVMLREGIRQYADELDLEIMEATA